MKIILASKSPRRRELLQRAGYQFDVMVSEGAEVITKKVPAEVVEELSLQKATEIAMQISEQVAFSEDQSTVVIGADTIVAIDGIILGKPSDRETAREMIEMISGRKHQVYTGVTLLCIDQDQKKHIRTFNECTDVEVYAMSTQEIEKYISTDEPYDKAGAYGIQGIFAVYIRKIDGDYNNVVGLPVARLYHELEDFMMEIEQDGN